MIREQYKFKEINWNMNFKDSKFMFAPFDPRVFNMFIAAYNERAEKVNVFKDTWIIFSDNTGIPMRWTKREGQLIHWSLIEVEDGSYCYNPVGFGQQGLIFDLVSNNFDGGIKVGKKIDEKEYEFKRDRFDLPHQHPYNAWYHLIKGLRILMRYYVKNRVASKESYLGQKMDVAELANLPQITNWNATTRPRFDFNTTYGTNKDFKRRFDSRTVNPQSRDYFTWTDDPEDYRPYGPKNQYGGHLMRRRYPRTIVRLDERGEKDQRARLHAGDTSTLQPNPFYDPSRPENQENNPKEILIADPKYANIANNYWKVYKYDPDYRENDWPVWKKGQWVLDPDAIDPDIIESHGWPQPGDYFGWWILDDLRTIINLMDWVFGSPSWVPWITYGGPVAVNSLSRPFDEPGAKWAQVIIPVSVGDTRIYIREGSSFNVGIFNLKGFQWPEVGDYVMGVNSANKVIAVNKVLGYIDIDHPALKAPGQVTDIVVAKDLFITTIARSRVKWLYTLTNTEQDLIPGLPNDPRISAQFPAQRYFGPIGHLAHWQTPITTDRNSISEWFIEPSGLWGTFPEPAISTTIQVGYNRTTGEYTGAIKVRAYELGDNAKVYIFVGKGFGITTTAALDVNSPGGSSFNDISWVFPPEPPKWKFEFLGSLNFGKKQSGRDLLIKSAQDAARYSLASGQDPLFYTQMQNIYESYYPEDDYSYREADFSSNKFKDDPNTVGIESAFQYQFFFVVTFDFKYRFGSTEPAPPISEGLQIMNKE